MVALGVAISVGLALTLAVFFLVAKGKQRRRRQGKAVAVAELVEKVKRQGQPIRLNSAIDEFDAHGQGRPFANTTGSGEGALK